MTNISPIPQGFHSVTPYIIASDASKLIDFLKQAFDAKEIDRFETENSIMHAIVQIGDSNVVLFDSNENMKPMPCFLYLYVENVDETYKNTLMAGPLQ